VSHVVIVHLIAHTTTVRGLRVEAALDRSSYPTGNKVSDEALAHVNLDPAAFHGDGWNYVITPNPKNP